MGRSLVKISGQTFRGADLVVSMLHGCFKWLSNFRMSDILFVDQGFYTAMQTLSIQANIIPFDRTNNSCYKQCTAYHRRKALTNMCTIQEQFCIALSTMISIDKISINNYSDMQV